MIPEVLLPVVFVHGVNNRKGPGYEAGVNVKTKFLKQCLNGATINGKGITDVAQISFPYWGDLATTFAWDMASLPRGEMQALSAGTEPNMLPFLSIVRDAVPGSIGVEPLLALAKRDLPNAVEMISTMALEQAPDGLKNEVADFVIAAQAYAKANPRPAWLANTTTDMALLGSLGLAITPHAQVQAQGLDQVYDVLGNAAVRLKSAATGFLGSAADKVGDFASTKLLAANREALNATLGRFFGDVFIYLDSRGDRQAPGEIPQRVLTGFDVAIAQAPSDEPLVIVGHSLGGVITFDLLGHFRPDLQVDLFVSVGSQVAHFEEMKLYKTSDRAIRPPQKAKTPTTIQHWINIYDEVDIFSYACKPVFDRVDVDARYDTKTYVVKAHGAYFDQSRFYERLRARIDGL